MASPSTTPSPARPRAGLITSSTRDVRSASVTITLARARRSACSKNSPLCAVFTAAVTAPTRPAPNQKYTHCGQVAANNATPSPGPMPESNSARAAAWDRRRICSKVTSTPSIDIITRSGHCSARRSRTAATLNCSTPKSAGPMGFSSHAAARTGTQDIRLPQQPGPDHRWRCSRSRPALPVRPGRSGAPSGAAPRSRAPLPVPGSASPGTSCSPR